MKNLKLNVIVIAVSVFASLTSAEAVFAGESDNQNSGEKISESSSLPLYGDISVKIEQYQSWLMHEYGALTALFAKHPTASVATKALGIFATVVTASNELVKLQDSAKSSGFVDNQDTQLAREFIAAGKGLGLYHSGFSERRIINAIEADATTEKKQRFNIQLSVLKAQGEQLRNTGNRGQKPNNESAAKSTNKNTRKKHRR